MVLFLVKTDKEVQAIIDVAQAADWTVEMTKGCHIKFVPPMKSQPIIVAATTPSDWRARKNLKSRLRRCGLKV